MADRIVQLIEAQGWQARYLDDESSYDVPLVAWALIEDANGDRRVDGLVLDRENIVFASDRVVGGLRFAYVSP